MPKKREAKAPKRVKTPAERAREACTIGGNLATLGLPHEDPGMARVLATLDEFVRLGAGFTGSVRSELGVVVHLKLSVQPHVTSLLRISRVSA
jgi:hypothetical protein